MKSRGAAYWRWSGILAFMAFGAGVGAGAPLSGGVGQWHSTDALPGSTVAHSATVLDNGEVLAAGGYGRIFDRLPLAVISARLYNPDTGKWRVASGRLHFGRLCHAAVKLKDGRVFLAGGIGQDKKPMRSAEVYQPATEQFEVVGEMAEARENPRLTLLKDGRILITGDSRQAELVGADSAGVLTIRSVASEMQAQHRCHLALRGKDGKVYLIGGRTRTIERFDPETETFTRCKAVMPLTLDDQAGGLLADGRFFLAGGQDIVSNQCVPNTWFYDPAADVLTAGPQLRPYSGARLQPGAADMMLVDLFEGDAERAGHYFLLCGGEYDPGPNSARGDQILTSAWLYRARENLLVEAAAMKYGHDDFAAVCLEGEQMTRRALIIGGHGIGDTFENHCELFTISIEP